MYFFPFKNTIMELKFGLCIQKKKAHLWILLQIWLLLFDCRKCAGICQVTAWFLLEQTNLSLFTTHFEFCHEAVLMHAEITVLPTVNFQNLRETPWSHRISNNIGNLNYKHTYICIFIYTSMCVYVFVSLLGQTPFYCYYTDS